MSRGIGLRRDRWTLGEIQLINEVNWNILLTSGIKIKRDSTSSVNESGKA